MEFKNLLSSNVKGTVVFHDENKIVVLDEYSSTHTYENVKPCTFYIGTQVKSGDTLGEFKESSLHYKVERVGNLTPVDEVYEDDQSLSEDDENLSLFNDIAINVSGIEAFDLEKFVQFTQELNDRLFNKK